MLSTHVGRLSVTGAYGVWNILRRTIPILANIRRDLGSIPGNDGSSHGAKGVRLRRALLVLVLACHPAARIFDFDWTQTRSELASIKLGGTKRDGHAQLSSGDAMGLLRGAC